MTETQWCPPHFRRLMCIGAVRKIGSNERRAHTCIEQLLVLVCSPPPARGPLAERFASWLRKNVVSEEIRCLATFESWATANP